MDKPDSNNSVSNTLYYLPATARHMHPRTCYTPEYLLYYLQYKRSYKKQLSNSDHCNKTKNQSCQHILHPTDSSLL